MFSTVLVSIVVCLDLIGQFARWPPIVNMPMYSKYSMSYYQHSLRKIRKKYLEKMQKNSTRFSYEDIVEKLQQTALYNM